MFAVPPVTVPPPPLVGGAASAGRGSQHLAGRNVNTQTYVSEFFFMKQMLSYTDALSKMHIAFSAGLGSPCPMPMLLQMPFTCTGLPCFTIFLFAFIH